MLRGSFMTENLHQIIEKIRPLAMNEKAQLIKIVVDMISNGEEFMDILKASESSTSFWNNSIDDEVWNNA